MKNVIGTTICSTVLLTMVVWFSAGAFAHGDHDHHHDDKKTSSTEQHDDHNDHVDIPPALAHASGIQTSEARAGVLQQTILLFGRLKPDPQGISHIRARFPGLIRQVNFQIGQTIKAGEVIARIEANDSLRVYEITSPINGVVIDRHANAGEYTGEDILFTLANYDRLELDLKVFARDAQRIRVGQTVEIYESDARSGAVIATGIVTYLTASDGTTPTLTAHVPLDNTQKHMIAGTLVEAAVTVAQEDVPLLLEKRALQKIDGQSVVFVQDGNHYEVRPVVLGRSNDQFIEVLDGLHSGERYVVENSYLIKADLEKSGAAHVH